MNNLFDQRNLVVFMLGAFVAFAAACTEEDGTTSNSSSSSAIVSGISTASSQLQTTANLIVPSSSSSSVGTLAALDSVWTTDPGVGPLSNTGTSSLQTWLTNMFNPSFQNDNGAKVTFAGRITNALDVLCILGASGVTTDATGLPANGSNTITLTQTMLDTCNVNEPSMVDVSVTMVTSTPADTTYYDKYFEITLPGGSTSCIYKFLARSAPPDVNIATAEDQNCDGRDHASRSIIAYNSSIGSFRFTYQSQAFSGGASGFEFYRGYYNAQSDEAYVLGFYGSDSTPLNSAGLNNYVAFTAVGKPAAGGNVAVSARSTGNVIADGDYQGCISATDGSITDNTDNLACGALGAGAPIATSFSEITDDYDAVTTINDLYGIDGTTAIPFTDNNDMF